MLPVLAVEAGCFDPLLLEGLGIGPGAMTLTCFNAGHSLAPGTPLRGTASSSASLAGAAHCTPLAARPSGLGGAAGSGAALAHPCQPAAEEGWLASAAPSR